MWLLFKFNSSHFCCYDYKESWSRFSDSVTACFNTLYPSIFSVELVVFWTETQMALNWDSWFFTRWVPWLTVTTSNTCTCGKQKVIGNEKDRAILEKNEKRRKVKWSGSVGIRSRDYQIFFYLFRLPHFFTHGAPLRALRAPELRYYA